MRVPKALTVAGSDSGGGAGIQADLKTFSAFRVFGMSVLTAVTAQNSLGVQGVFNLPPAFVTQQLDSVLADFGADAVKIGMLSTAPIIGAVAERLRAHRQDRVVLDPVMIAKSGDPLLQADARTALIAEMLPLAAVVTPNLHEASALADMPVDSEADMAEAARRIVARGARTALVKGGHLKESATDVLWDGRTLTRFSGPRLDSPNTHGTGCTLSSAIAAGLAHGRPLEDAVRGRQGLRHRGDPRGLRAGPGRGRAPPLRGALVGRWDGSPTTRCPSWSTSASCARASCAVLIALLIGLGISFPFAPRVSTSWPALSRPPATSWSSSPSPRPSGPR